MAITCVRLLDDVQMRIEYAAFPGDLEALPQADLETGSLHHELQQLGHLPTRGSSVISAATAGSGAAPLGVDPGAPILTRTGTITDQHEQPLEYTIRRYVADRLRPPRRLHRRHTRRDLTAARTF